MFPDSKGSIKPKYVPKEIQGILDIYSEETIKQLGRKSSVRFIEEEALKRSKYIIY